MSSLCLSLRSPALYIYSLWLAPRPRYAWVSGPPWASLPGPGFSLPVLPRSLPGFRACAGLAGAVLLAFLPAASASAGLPSLCLLVPYLLRLGILGLPSGLLASWLASAFLPHPLASSGLPLILWLPAGHPA